MKRPVDFFVSLKVLMRSFAYAMPLNNYYYRTLDEQARQRSMNLVKQTINSVLSSDSIHLNSSLPAFSNMGSQES